MQELAKILEEIEQAKREPWYRLNNYDVRHKLDGAINRIVDIILKHMNDGWIPAEERLPTKEERKKDNNNFLVQVDSGERFSCEYDPEANGYDNPQWCCNIPVVAWRPLPEPYHPERSNEHDGE